MLTRKLSNQRCPLIDSTLSEGATIILSNWYKKLVGSILAGLLSTQHTFFLKGGGANLHTELILSNFTQHFQDTKSDPPCPLPPQKGTHE